MGAQKPVAEDVLLQCEVCLKEIPLSSGDNAEADEYVSHFCGLECYSQWRSQAETPDEEPTVND